MAKIRLILQLILIFGASSFLATNLQAKTMTANEVVMEQFYEKLEDIAQESFESQISNLKSFVKQNPNFERAYVDLEERWTSKGAFEHPKTFFLSESFILNRSYCNWMIGKIQARQDSAQMAYNSLLMAIRSEQPPPELVYDFINFLYRYQNNSSSLFILKQKIQPPYLSLAQAFLSLRKMEYGKALHLLNKLDTNLKNHLFVKLIIARTLEETHHNAEAEELCKTGLRTARELGDRRFEALFLIQDGRLKVAAGKADDAQQNYKEALKIANRVDDRFAKQRALGHMAGLSFRKSLYENALNQYTEASQIATSIGAFDDEARWIAGKAQTLDELGAYNQALETYDESYEYASFLKNEQLLLKVRIDKGNFFSNLNLNHLAEIELKHAYETAKAKNLHKKLSQIQLGLAFLDYNKKQYKHARKTFLEVLDRDSVSLRTVDKVFYRFMIGETYFFENRYDLAKIEYEKAFKMADEWAQQGFYPGYLENYKAYARQRIGNIKTEQGNASEAIKIYNEDLIKEGAEKDVNLKIDLNFDLGDAFYALNDLDKAAGFYTKASNLLEENRAALEVEHFRIGYLSQGIRIYHALISTYFKRFQATKSPTDLEKLFGYLEMSRLRTLKDWNVDENRLSEQYQAYLDACTDLQTIQRRIRYNPKLMDSLLSRHETARYNLLSKKLEIIEQPKDSTEDILSLKKLSTQISESELSLLLYHVSEKSSFVLAANDTNIQIVPLNVNPDSLQSAVRGLLHPFHDLSKNSIEEVSFRANTAYQLYQTLVKPVEENVSLKKRIVIIPDLELTGLPFEVLLARPPNVAEYLPTEQPEYAEDFLLHRYSFVYSPSTWLLTSEQSKRENNPETLVLANPIDETSSASLHDLLAARAGWRSDILWYADTEADSIKTIHPEAKIFKRRKATKAVLKQQSSKHQILHFATHAFVDTVFDDFSGLVLATSEDPTDDGLCMGYEISNLDLNCDLVTLSGCETGRGRIVAGEGVLGLPRKFLGAGAKSVLMTLWKVDDKFTSELMPRFYDYYLNRGLSKAGALREAKRTVMNRPDENDVYYQHPFFWASFTLYGQPGMTKENTNPLPFYAVSALVAGLIALSALYFFRRAKS